jgi:hypothetical protein
MENNKSTNIFGLPLIFSFIIRSFWFLIFQKKSKTHQPGQRCPKQKE